MEFGFKVVPLKVTPTSYILVTTSAYQLVR